MTDHQSSTESYLGIPRNLIDWFPTINPLLCQSSKCHHECINACPKKLYKISDNGKIRITNLYSCTVGDISCSFACPFNAISFPSKQELKEMLNKARAKMNN